MRPVDRYFGEYGAFHRDPRNEVTHLLGIPSIVLAVVMWLANVPLGHVGGVPVDLAWIAIGAVAVFYIRLHVLLGVVTTLILIGFHFLGVRVLGANVWVATGLFVAGWILQFVGHAFEGKRPAFVQNGVHLLVGPMWILSRGLERVGVSASAARAAGERKN